MAQALSDFFADKNSAPFDGRIANLNLNVLNHIKSENISFAVGKGRFSEQFEGSVLVSREPIPELNVKTVLKVMKNYDYAKKSFLNELRAGTLRHPAIQPVFATYEDSVQLCVLSAFSELGDLEDLIKLDEKRLIQKEGVILEPCARLRVLIQISSAILYIHKLKFTHNDIKLANIVVDHCKNARLIDFGLYQKFDAVFDKISGTPCYLPNEINDETRIEALMFYSFGVVILAVLTGESPESSEVHITFGVESPESSETNGHSGVQSSESSETHGNSRVQSPESSEEHGDSRVETPMSSEKHEHSGVESPKSSEEHGDSKDETPMSSGKHEHSGVESPKSSEEYGDSRDETPESSGKHEHSGVEFPKSSEKHGDARNETPMSSRKHEHSGVESPKSSEEHGDSRDVTPMSSRKHEHSGVESPKSSEEHRDSRDETPESSGKHEHSGVESPKSSEEHGDSRNETPESSGKHEHSGVESPESSEENGDSADESPMSSGKHGNSKAVCKRPIAPLKDDVVEREVCQCYKRKNEKYLKWTDKQFSSLVEIALKCLRSTKKDEKEIDFCKDIHEKLVDVGRIHFSAFKYYSKDVYNPNAGESPESLEVHRNSKVESPESSEEHGNSKVESPESSKEHGHFRDESPESSGKHEHSGVESPKSSEEHGYSRIETPESSESHGYSRDVSPQKSEEHVNSKVEPPESSKEHGNSRDVYNPDAQAKPETHFKHDNCENCIINPVLQTQAFQHIEHNQCSSEVQLCRECIRSHYLNPIFCPTCGECRPNVDGASTALICLAGDGIGQYKKEERTVFQNDITLIANAFTERLPSVLCFDSERDFQNVCNEVGQNKDRITVVLFYSGHYDPKEGRFILKQDKYLSKKQLNKAVNKLINKKSKVVLFLGCCNAPSVSKWPARDGSNSKQAICDFIQVNATREDQAADADITEGSLFTRYIVQALDPRKRCKNCKICDDFSNDEKSYDTIKKIVDYVQSHYIANDYKRNIQKNIYGSSGSEEFVFSLKTNITIDMKMIKPRSDDTDSIKVEYFSSFNEIARKVFAKYFNLQDVDFSAYDDQIEKVIKVEDEITNESITSEKELVKAWNRKHNIRVSLCPVVHSAYSDDLIIFDKVQDEHGTTQGLSRLTSDYYEFRIPNMRFVIYSC